MAHCQNYNKQTESLKFLNKLKEDGGRVTEQRKAIVEAIFRFKFPFSAEELLEKTKLKSIDLATIYRSLTRFTNLGLLSPVDLADGVTRYEYIADENHHHHHIVCTQCKTIETVDFCVLQEQEHLIEKMGYRNISHKLEFFGLCKNCY